MFWLVSLLCMGSRANIPHKKDNGHDSLCLCQLLGSQQNENATLLLGNHFMLTQMLISFVFLFFKK